MLITRASCRFDTITPALLRLLAIIEEYARDHDLTLVVLTGTEGHHSATSRHAQGEAVDLQCAPLTTPDQRTELLNGLLARLGPLFSGYVHQTERSNVFLHLQLRRGTTYTPPPVPHHPAHRFDQV